jgi:SAM-dependent methyltransferase
VRDDERKLPIDTASMDLVICIEVGVIEEEWFLLEASRVLKPGGIFVGTVWNVLSWRGMAANLKNKLSKKQTFYKRSYLSLRRRLQRSDFEVRAEQGYCWAPFGRHSNSCIVPLATAIERRFGLRRLPRLSPWVIFTAVRK